jgi:hypothetical protein
VSPAAGAEAPTVAGGETPVVAPASVAMTVPTAARPAEPTDEPGIVFSLVAVAAILVAVVVTYLFATQTFGSDICLTRMSYAVNGPDLTWPGKISVAR